MAETAKVVIDVMGEAYPHPRRAARRDPRGDRARGGPVRPDARRRARAARAALDPALVADGATGVDRPPRRGPPAGCAACSPGDLAFRLHDTFGFPIDLTVELAAEYGVGVDRAGFEAALAEQRDRSRSGKKAELAKHAELAALYQAIQARHGDTAFLGYETTTADGTRRRDRPRRHRVRRADRPGRRRGRPRPLAVLRRGRRPGRRSRRAPRGGWRDRRSSTSRTPRSRLAG